MMYNACIAMDKFSFITLWDAYRGLLTDNRQEITDMYFNLDLTVSEIAAEMNISRQAVSECLKNCKKQLEEYEEKLGFCKRLYGICTEQSLMRTRAGKWAETFRKEHPELADEADKILAILDADYSDEAEQALKEADAAGILSKDYTELVYGRKKDGSD